MMTKQVETVSNKQPPANDASGTACPAVQRGRWSRRFKQLGVAGFAFFLIKGLAWVGVGLVVYLAR